MISIIDEIKDFIKNYKCKPDLFLKDDKPKQVILIDDKPKQVNLLEPLPFSAPEEEQPEEMEVSDEINVSDDIQTETDEDGQITLSLE